MKRRDFNKNLGMVGLAAPLLPSIMSLNKENEKIHVTIGTSSEMFPHSGMYNIKTNPGFLIMKNNQTEILTFDADLIFQTREANKNQGGFRFVDINISDWSGETYSKLLDGNLGFRVTNTLQSNLTSVNLNQDFPSKLELNVEYDILFNGEVVEREVSARAETTLDSFVPAANNVFKMDQSSLQVGNHKLEVLFFAA